VNTVFLILMKLMLNGKEREVANGISLIGLLESLQIRPGRVVVERNREIVARDSFSTTKLTEGDVLEIVHFVGGG
jgi:thiamine biosynthesis protein ThiS